jgi:hypothetical protein
MMNQFQLTLISHINAKYEVTAPYFASFFWIKRNLQNNIVPNVPLYKPTNFHNTIRSRARQQQHTEILIIAEGSDHILPKIQIEEWRKKN